ncbi:sigma-70 family RNA polymerase sigma factor [Sulfuriflexus mobilis]|uniref:sigma-70 family RNA polymerase sigma factor n=1 Tax=Sulfuriflexus mobilis TaxID=1811807 RepID=UPI001559EFEF|nr:sigma-70 family RNA polymerase sigma factor [Sulfuriflexus mobilis]
MTLSSRQKHFQTLTHPWAGRLFGAALRQTNDSHIAEDWVQEALLRAWRDFSQLSEDITVYAWLLKILDHVAADDVRKEKRRHQLAPVLTVEDKYLNEHPCSAPGPFEKTVNQQTNDQLMTAVQNLPEEFRQAVLLRDLEGLSYLEVAYILEIPKGTVMSRLSRGRRMLASALLELENKEKSADIMSIDVRKKR